MLHFANDYTQGVCQEILDAIVKTNFEDLAGYGADKYCESAKAKIRKVCEVKNADVHFLTGGTQANAVVINSMLESYEGVIAAETGHIAIHEAGAIEFTGHKVLTLPHHSGKIDVNELKEYLLCRRKSRTYGFSWNGLYFTSNRIWNFVYQKRINRNFRNL